MKTKLSLIQRMAGIQAALEREWLPEVRAYLATYYRENPGSQCSLGELFQEVAAPRGLTIGMFHDGIRKLVAEQIVLLHRLSCPEFMLPKAHCAMTSPRGIEYYIGLYKA